jgi:hypothetical protein
MTVVSRAAEISLSTLGGSVFSVSSVPTTMATTVETPDADETCAYCGSRIFDHDPICVRDCTDACGSPDYFCHHACLSAYIDDDGLATGDACRWTPGGADCS